MNYTVILLSVGSMFAVKLAAMGPLPSNPSNEAHTIYEEQDFLTQARVTDNLLTFVTIPDLGIDQYCRLLTYLIVDYASATNDEMCELLSSKVDYVINRINFFKEERGCEISEQFKNRWRELYRTSTLVRFRNFVGEIVSQDDDALSFVKNFPRSSFVCRAPRAEKLAEALITHDLRKFDQLINQYSFPLVALLVTLLEPVPGKHNFSVQKITMLLEKFPHVFSDELRAEAQRFIMAVQTGASNTLKAPVRKKRKRKKKRVPYDVCTTPCLPTFMEQPQHEIQKSIVHEVYQEKKVSWKTMGVYAITAGTVFTLLWYFTKYIQKEKGKEPLQKSHEKS